MCRTVTTATNSVIIPSQLDFDQFMQVFGGIYEHSPWVAESTFKAGITQSHDSVDALACAMAEALSIASHEMKLSLINAHPDLAGKAALCGELTADSNSEQSSAGLDQCSPDELERFHQLNASYKTKFGFPFIKAVKNSNRFEILAAFEQRLNNDENEEFETALTEINKIARLRLQGILTTNEQA